MLWSPAVTPVHRTAAVALALALFVPACEGKPTTGRAGTAASASDASAAAASATPAPRKATAPDHGYGDQIAWRGLEEGFKEAAALGRPMMLVVHAGWCPRCKELKQRFFDPAIVETSDQLIMVNLDQDETPEALRHGPDGQYIPRILFFDAQGHLDADLSNPGRSKYKYFYTPKDDLGAIMQQALERHPPAAHL